MAHTLLEEFEAGPITAIDAQQGTTVYFAYGQSNGLIKSYTISGGAIATIATLGERINCLINDGTYLYVALGRRLMRYTIAGGAWSELERYKFDITSLSKYSSVLYVGLENGDLCSY